jgi:putative membrane-bound dehydrogenase-like protein
MLNFLPTAEKTLSMTKTPSIRKSFWPAVCFAAGCSCLFLSAARAQSPENASSPQGQKASEATPIESPATTLTAGLRAPRGFAVSLFADDDLAHDIYSMTLDAEGRVVVAGRGYVKTLHDDNADGRADRATLFSKVPASGAHGLCFDGPDLLCTGDKALMRLKDEDGDGAADGKPEIWATLNNAEHGANGITRGPDGAFYVACGNDAGATAILASDERSPVQNPNCGAMLRFSADGKESQILAHGFRNPYDLDFNSAGQLFTVDADGERDQFMPWYTPTRLFDVALGMHHGWVLKGWQHSWNRSEALFDNVPRLVEIGRGSPTGLIVYRHTNFPQAYRDNVLSCCWTLGRVYRFALKPDGSSYKSQTEIFLETTGEVGFAPVDLAVGRSGELYVAIGGRGTRGGVFCVKYVGEPEDTPEPTDPLDTIAQVLTAPQPLAAWSRKRWMPLAEKVGAAGLLATVEEEQRPTAQRTRAIEILTDLFDGLPYKTASRLVQGKNPALVARTYWALAMKPCPEARAMLISGMYHRNPYVARAAAENLLRLPAVTTPLIDATPTDDLPTDSRLRAGILLALSKDQNLQSQSFRSLGIGLERLWLKYFRHQTSEDDFQAAFEAFSKSDTAAQRLEAIRLMQIALGDMPADAPIPIAFAGYSPQLLNEASLERIERARPFVPQLVAALGSEEPTTDYELARLLAMLRADSPELPAKLADKWSEDSRLEDDLHYMIVLALCPGQRTERVTRQTAAALANLHFKLAAGQMTPSRNWPQRVNEILAELLKLDSRLASALVVEPKFRLPTQSLFALQLPPEQRLAAACKFLQQISSDEPASGLAEGSRVEEVATRWTAELVELVAQLPPEEFLPALRSQWEDFLLRDDIALVLAKRPTADDRQRLLEALSSVQPQVVEAAALALAQLPRPTTGNLEADLLPIFTALRQACLSPAASGVRQSLHRLLAAWSSQKIEVAEPKLTDKQASAATRQQAVSAAYAPWFSWFEKSHPLAAAKLTGLGKESGVEWVMRLQAIDWNAANIARGKAAFEKRSCAKCHSGQNRLGPDLAGAAGRFARGDLLTAILEPSRAVSPLYQTTQIVTGSGKIYQGLVVYESPEGTLLQTSVDTTIRISGEEILSMRKSRQSLMPTGLLQGATDAELADLLAYLMTLGPAK